MTVATIQSRLYIGTHCSPETEQRIREAYGTPKSESVGFIVMQTSVGHKTVDCCCSGGQLDHATKEPSFTLIGLGALEALINLPGEASALIYAEVRKGRTPVAEKIKQIILDAPPGARICFIGDLAGELDGVLTPALNPSGTPIVLNGSLDDVTVRLGRP